MTTELTVFFAAIGGALVVAPVTLMIIDCFKLRKAGKS